MIVYDEGLLRGLWKIGCIQALIRGQTPSKNACFSTLNREQLYPLEIHHPTESAQTPDSQQVSADPSNRDAKDSPPPVQRPPQREARTHGEKTRRAWTRKVN